MEIGSIGSSGYGQMRVKPQPPAEPTPPAGGNIENRQPPSEPSPPSPPPTRSTSGLGGTLDIRV